VNLIRAVSLFVVLFASTVNATYIYEANQSLIDLKTNYIATSYNMNAGDDQVSSVFNLDFTFTFYEQDFTMAKMATNGCLHFWKSGSSGYCNDYTPDPLPEITYTLYPFWTDLIRDNGSSVLARNFTDKTVFGWYNLREYNRSGSDNSFEVILWKSDDSFEFRYGGLDIINHDVLIGEQGTSQQTYTYLFHDECGVGTTNVVGTCVNTDWNNTSFNTLLENGGSLYGLGSGNALDCSNPLNNTACSGYEAAYLTQQCDLDGLYSTQCPNYWDDLFDYECSYNAQYSPACPGYMVETFEQNTYYEEDMYGYDDYEEDMYGYTESYYEEDYYFEEEFVYTAESQGIEEDHYFEEELYYEETLYFEEEYILFEEEYLEPFVEEFDALPEEVFIPLSYIEEAPYIEELYEEILLVEEYYETDYDLPILEDFLLEHFEHEEHIEDYIEEEPIEFLEFETIEELEEWIEHEEELAESVEDEVGELEDAETVEEEIQDRDENIETVVAENEDKKDNKRAEQLNVVANTIRAASNSVSGTTAGTSSHATGNSVASGGVVASSQSSAVSSSVSGGTISIDSSPSISAQVASSAQQTQEILSMSASDVSASSFSGGETMDQGTTTADQGPGTTDSSTTVSSDTTSVSDTGGSSESATTGSVEIVVAGGQNTTSETQDMQSQIDTAVSENTVESEADQIANQIVAQNIKTQQEEIEQEQQETGEYADSSQLVAYMGYVPGFNAYRQVTLDDASNWYTPKAIYGNVSIPDNNSAFVGLYGQSLTGIKDLMDMQPQL
jgi:hypothetical protein